MKYKAAIFDMDGTVLDTAGDLTDAINHALGSLGYRDDFTVEDSKFFFGSGIKVAITRAFALAEGMASGRELLRVGTEKDDISPRIDEELVSKALEIYRPYYSTHNDIKTREYPGITELLKSLKKAGIKTAVVSNKPNDSVVALSERLFNGLFDVYMGEQPGIERKPAPDMTLKILSELGMEKKDAVYIGDSEIDLLTAKNSGLDCITVTWGFRSREYLEEHGASVFADNTGEVLKLFEIS
ncbi:MAG: HAD family hydrolase [Lachnospiraceae bacterium]|nr:HAD family hydrolase [Lachnospiraceae bacterium]